MLRRSSALVFALLWAGAMPWTADAAVLVPDLGAIAAGAVAGLAGWWIAGPSGRLEPAPAQS
ncbi:hypothetical protein RHODGE_RHODGE_01683 [Rhodoplanes serenus]|uniref:Uncharacterized protein n=1 Tax=Rhodoplanes serenus TaxID=200615 RepID=A0A447CTE9_9BRAD|nr:hypothetical protein [Rhodoplanes serenus]VCU08514.1 hypothetical protein RHODGE_RHODGE_01683 [Rhodoplanes serenus]